MQEPISFIILKQIQYMEIGSLLSTCEYSQNNGRLVVIAKQIEVGNYET